LERPQTCSTAMGCDGGTDAAVRLLLPHRWRRVLPHGSHGWFSPTAAAAPPCNRWPRLLLPYATLDCGATHVSVDRSVRGGGPLSGGGGGAVSMVMSRSPRWLTGSQAADLASQRVDPDSSLLVQSAAVVGCWRGPNPPSEVVAGEAPIIHARELPTRLYPAHPHHATTRDRLRR
jgi:hypothetical protein